MGGGQCNRVVEENGDVKKKNWGYGENNGIKRIFLVYRQGYILCILIIFFPNS